MLRKTVAWLCLMAILASTWRSSLGFGLAEAVASAGTSASQWQLIGFADVGVYSMAFSPSYSQDSTIMVGTIQGVFRSRDAGVSWQAVQTNPGLGALTFSPNYAIDLTIFGTSGTGIYRSTDGGTTWGVVGLTGEATQSLAISPNFATDRTVFTGTTSGRIYRSLDGGVSWVSIGPAKSGYAARLLVISPDYATDHTLFVGYAKSWAWYSGGVYKSTNSGQNWVAVNNGLTYQEVHGLAVSPNYRQDHTLWVSVWNGGVYRTTNGGELWQEANTDQPNRRTENIAVSPNYTLDRTLFLGTWGEYADGGIYASTNGATSWSYASSGLATHWIHGLAFSPTYAQDHVVLAGGEQNNGGGLWAYAPTTSSLSGRVTDAASQPLADVTVSDGAGHIASTDSDGDYTLSGLAAGTHTLTPSKSSYTFSPASRTVTVPPDATGQDFVGGPSLASPITLSAVYPPASQPSQIMQGGQAHRYFEVRDATGRLVEGVTVAFGQAGSGTVEGVTVAFGQAGSGTSEARGLLDVAVEPDMLGNPGIYPLSAISATYLGQAYALASPVSFEVEVTARSLTSRWGAGASLQSRAGGSKLVQGYVEAEHEGGLEAELAETYPLDQTDDTLTMKASQTNGVGGGIGIGPEVGFKLGPIKGGVEAGTETGLVWKAIEEYRSVFDDPYASEQQQAEAVTALVGVYRAGQGFQDVSGGQTSLLSQIILRLLEQIPDYRSYVAEETGGTGVRLTNTTSVTAKFDALAFGKNSKGIRKSRIAHLECGPETEISGEILAQWTTDPLTNDTLRMSWTDEGEASVWAGIEAGLSYGVRAKYARELGYLENIEREVTYGEDGHPEEVMFSVISQARDETKAGFDIDPRGAVDWGAIAGKGVEYQVQHRYIMSGAGLAEALVRVPGLARLDKVEQMLSSVNPLQIGRAPARQDLTALLGCDPTCLPEFTYEKWALITTDFQPSLELGFTAILKLEVGGEFKVQWGKDVLLERGVVRGGNFYPLESYTLDGYVDAPERDLGWLINQSVEAAFDQVKHFFNTVQEVVEEGIAWIVNAVAARADGVIQGTLQLTGGQEPLAGTSAIAASSPFTVTATGWVPASTVTALAQAAALGIETADPGFVVGGVFELQPFTQTLATPASLLLTYTDAAVGGRDEGQFRLFRWEPADNAWRPQTAQLDAALNQATASITRLGTYAIGHDSEPPAVLEALPAAGVAQVTYLPEFRITLDDAGAGIDPSTVQLTVDGAPVAAAYDPVLKQVSYGPAVPFANGARSFSLTAADTVGNAMLFAGAFTIAVPAPALTAVTPNPVYAGIGSVVRVAGSGFAAGVSVAIGPYAAQEVQLLSASRLAVTLPATVPIGSYTLTVTNADGQFATLPDALAVAPLIALDSVDITGPTEGIAPAEFAFTAAVSPVAAALPITYTWNVVGEEPITHMVGLTDSITAAWDAPGQYQVVVTATNPGGPISATHTIAVSAACEVDLAADRSETAVTLSWPHLGAGIAHYEVYRGATPWFDPLAAGDRLPDVFAPPSGDVTSTDGGAPVLAGTAAFYTVVPVTTIAWRLPPSTRAGVFNFALTPGTSP